jgi:hypothetical protein
VRSSVAQTRISKRAEWREQEPHSDALNDARPSEPDVTALSRHSRDQLKGASGYHHSANQQRAVVDLVDQISDGAAQFAVKNLGFIKFQILDSSIVEIELHPRNVGLPALLACTAAAIVLASAIIHALLNFEWVM